MKVENKKFRKVKSFKYKVTAECEYKKRTKEEVKITKIFFNTDYIIKKAIYDYGDFKRWLDFQKEINEGYGYDFEFLGLRSIRINIERTKASIGNYIDLPPDLKNSKSKLNISSYKYNCLQLTIIAWLHPAMDHATRESKYVNNLIGARQLDEDDFAYIMKIQKLYNINIWVYTPCGGGKVELFKTVDDFDKDRKDVSCLKFLDSYNFLAMPLDQLAKIYGCKTKTLYPYKYFGLDSYDEVIGNLKIEDFKSSLSNKLPTQEEVDIFNKDNSHKTGKDRTIEFFQNNTEIID